MARLTKALITPDGIEHEFIGKTWYGNCTTSASTQTKAVTITGFTSSELVNGTRVIIRFNSAQGYNGLPYLNISNTGAKSIFRRSGENAARYEWNAGEIVAFVYYDSVWMIENGGVANTTSFGKTILSSYVAERPMDNNSAITPGGTYFTIESLVNNSTWFNNEDEEPILLFSTNTPAASEWSGNDCFLVDSNFGNHSSTINQNSGTKLLKITFGDYVFYYNIDYGRENTYEFYLSTTDFSITSVYNGNNSGYTISVDSDYSSLSPGVYPFKIEFYDKYHGDGLVRGSILKDYIESQGFLTLADLPIYDGSVS